MNDETRPDEDQHAQWDVPTEPMEDPTPPDAAMDVKRRPKHSLADANIGGTLGDPKNQ